MRALLTALAALPLIACAEDDEDALEPDADQPFAEEVGELPAIDPSHPELAQDAPDVTFTPDSTRPQLPARSLAREPVRGEPRDRATADPNGDRPPLEETLDTVVQPPKPQAPDARHQPTRIPRPTNTF